MPTRIVMDACVSCIGKYAEMKKEQEQIEIEAENGETGNVCLGVSVRIYTSLPIGLQICF